MNHTQLPNNCDFVYHLQVVKLSEARQTAYFQIRLFAEQLQRVNLRVAMPIPRLQVAYGFDLIPQQNQDDRSGVSLYPLQPQPLLLQNQENLVTNVRRFY